MQYLSVLFPLIQGLNVAQEQLFSLCPKQKEHPGQAHARGRRKFSFDRRDNLMAYTVKGCLFYLEHLPQCAVFKNQILTLSCNHLRQYQTKNGPNGSRDLPKRHS